MHMRMQMHMHVHMPTCIAGGEAARGLTPSLASRRGAWRGGAWWSWTRAAGAS